MQDYVEVISVVDNIVVKNWGVNFLFDFFEEHKYQLYLVGGCVRDLLLGREPHDYDFATNATPQEMREMVLGARNPCIGILPTGEKYGTMTIKTLQFDGRVFYNPESYEITTFRADGSYGDGRRPDAVSFAESLLEDVSRRDFTINAMAWNPKVGLMDYFEGQSDLASGVIKCVGNPVERFREDSLRILRCVRFAVRYNFAIEVKTLDAALEEIPLLRNVSSERVGNELMQIWSYKISNFDTAFLLSKIHQLIFQTVPFVKEAQVMESSDNPILKVVLLCKNLDLTHIKTQLNKLAVGSDFIRKVSNVYEAVKYYQKYDVEIERKPFLIKKCFNYCLQPEEVESLLEYISAFPIDSRFVAEAIYKLLYHKEPISLKDLAINGEDLQAIGIKEGVQIGQLLEICLTHIWEHPECNDKEYLSKFVEELINEGKNGL